MSTDKVKDIRQNTIKDLSQLLEWTPDKLEANFFMLVYQLGAVDLLDNSPSPTSKEACEFIRKRIGQITQTGFPPESVVTRLKKDVVFRKMCLDDWDRYPNESRYFGVLWTEDVVDHVAPSLRNEVYAAVCELVLDPFFRPNEELLSEVVEQVTKPNVTVAEMMDTLNDFRIRSRAQHFRFEEEILMVSSSEDDRTRMW